MPGRERIACIGGGVIGGGWVARFLLHGHDVALFDPAPDAERKIGEVLENARRSLPGLYDVPLSPEGRLTFAGTLAEAVSGAAFIQESVPERLDLKRQVYRDIEAHADAEAVIGSSTSGFKPSDLQDGMVHPQRLLVTHPFNPVYLLPLVEVVPGAATTSDVVEQTERLLDSVGMKPLVVRREIDAHIADRLLEAVWRESLWLVNDGIATTREIDDAIRYGFGLRWAQMGLFETYRVAGGEAGMAHFITQFGPALQWPWTRLTDVPELTDELVGRIADQSDAQSGAYSIRELERIRDDNLVGILAALKATDWGAGELLNRQQARLAGQGGAAPEFDRPLRLLERPVPPSWVDYNGHMTEHRYLQVFGDTADALLALIGAGGEYVAGGHSYYTAETHIVYRAEIKGGDRIYATCQVLKCDEKRLHIFHRIHDGESDALLASGEQILLHVDAASGKTCPAAPDVKETLFRLAAAQADLPRPEDAGRHVGKRG